ncbi:hypothetical protein JCM6882_007910 [Rhodosporidiobolus microsporus]
MNRPRSSTAKITSYAEGSDEESTDPRPSRASTTTGMEGTEGGDGQAAAAKPVKRRKVSKNKSLSKKKSSASPRLPTELIELILNFVAYLPSHSQRTLAQCCLVSHIFHNLVQPRFYHRLSYTFLCDHESEPFEWCLLSPGDYNFPWHECDPCQVRYLEIDWEQADPSDSSYDTSLWQQAADITDEDLESCTRDDDEEEAAYRSGDVTALRIQRVLRARDDAEGDEMACLLVDFPALEQLDIYGAKHWIGHQLHEFFRVLRDLQHLQVLRLPDDMMYNADRWISDFLPSLRQTGSFPSLRELRVPQEGHGRFHEDEYEELLSLCYKRGITLLYQTR